MIQKLERDTIVEEIHQTRQAIAEKFNGDIAAMLADARQRQAASGRPIWQGHGANKGADPTPGESRADAAVE